MSSWASGLVLATGASGAADAAVVAVANVAPLHWEPVTDFTLYPKGPMALSSVCRVARCVSIGAVTRPMP